MGKKASQRQTQNVVANPWAPSQPFLKDLIGDTQDVYQAGNLTPQPFGSRLADESAYSQQARQTIADTAMGGNPITAPTQAAYADIVGGDPYQRLDAVTQQAMRDVMPATASYFADSGMLNSSIAGERMAEAAMGAVAPIHFGAYNQDQNRRVSAMSMAPQMAGLSYLDPQMLNEAGMMENQRAQAELDDAAALYYETADRPYQDIARASQLGMGFGGLGGTQSGYSKQQQDPGYMSIIGGMMKPASLLGGILG